ncbi:DUF6470 family protein [Bacillus alkalicellulosilyticus]|uniref:DUF6470 family protein n=1 Tax=Alkalihalobacterium alkalicellulosilyticum TaxID=1912214 RepID=UPI0009964665|nr:DUF6470 family protein [Bacillus alkalicellulosilyticus]
MDMPYLEMSSTKAQIGMRSHQPPLSISQRQADMRINNDHGAKIEISSKASQLFIDQTEAFADAGLISPLRKATKYTRESVQRVNQYIAETAQEGDQLMRIENGGGQIQRLAKNKGRLPEYDFKYAQVPSGTEKTKIKFSKPDLQIRARESRFDISVKKNEPIIHVPKWQTDIYVRQKESLHIRPVGLNVNKGL